MKAGEKYILVMLRILGVGLLNLYVFSTSWPLISQERFEAKLLLKLDASVSKYEKFGFSPIGSYVYAIDEGRGSKVWETANLRLKHELAGKFTQASFSPDEKWIAFFSKKDVNIFNVETSKFQLSITENKSSVKYLAWSPNSKWLAIELKKYSVNVIDIDASTVKSSLVIHPQKKKKGIISRFLDTAYPTHAIFTPDSKRLLTTCNDTTAELWDVESGSVVYALTHGPQNSSGNIWTSISDARISSDGKWILTQSLDSSRLWNAKSGQLVQHFPGFLLLGFSPDSRYLGLFDEPNGNVATQLLNLETQTMSKIIPKYSGRIVEWSPSSDKFITDRTWDEVSRKIAFIWENNTGKQLAEMKTYARHCFDLISTCISDSDSFSFDSGGKVLMVQNEKLVKFLDANNGRLLAVAQGAQSPAYWNRTRNLFLAKDAEKGKIGLWEIVR